jgi:hypothetical protein
MELCCVGYGSGVFAGSIFGNLVIFNKPSENDRVILEKARYLLQAKCRDFAPRIASSDFARVFYETLKLQIFWQPIERDNLRLRR